ncbi:hypothetical protein [Streptomyces coeruleorubidus]|uniref:hypothetical protein n=1 Tax=Streptomyces coeruleorubidus TaxID=116188 RepID=UPI0033BE73DB
MNESAMKTASPPTTTKPGPAGLTTGTWVPRLPFFHELPVSQPDEVASLSEDRRSSYVRSQNFIVGYTSISAGGSLSEVDLPDEHIILVPEGMEVAVQVPGQAEVPAEGPALVIVPEGTSQVVARGAGELWRVFTTRAADVVARARNNAVYAEPDPAVTPLPDQPPVPGPGTVRVYRADDIPEDPARFGRIFRTDSLMFNWFHLEHVERDTDKLSPHVHDDFEQASVTFQGDYIHHLRSPWTPRLREWRDDQHLQVSSPSVTIIPPGNVHTSRSVGEGLHQMADVFAPPRTDFLGRGWVLNASDYPGSGA